jgi:hypothetical protein
MPAAASSESGIPTRRTGGSGVIRYCPFPFLGPTFGVSVPAVRIFPDPEPISLR